MLTTFAILIATIVLFIYGRPRADLVALLALLALTLTGILSPAQALAGFSDATVIMIAALFVVSEGSVSYTHLDVYKRQVVSMVASNPL